MDERIANGFFVTIRDLAPNPLGCHAVFVMTWDRTFIEYNEGNLFEDSQSDFLVDLRNIIGAFHSLAADGIASCRISVRPRRAVIEIVVSPPHDVEKVRAMLFSLYQRFIGDDDEAVFGDDTLFEVISKYEVQEPVFNFKTMSSFNFVNGWITFCNNCLQADHPSSRCPFCRACGYTVLNDHASNNCPIRLSAIKNDEERSRQYNIVTDPIRICLKARPL